jgi:hypothetical protein
MWGVAGENNEFSDGADFFVKQHLDHIRQPIAGSIFDSRMYPTLFYQINNIFRRILRWYPGHHRCGSSPIISAVTPGCVPAPGKEAGFFTTEKAEIFDQSATLFTAANPRGRPATSWT